jgi:hypothetical protein
MCMYDVIKLGCVGIRLNFEEREGTVSGCAAAVMHLRDEITKIERYR